MTRVPSEVVAAEPEALRAAARRLDRGAGTAQAQPRAADAIRELPVVFEGGACRLARAVR